MTDKPFTGDGNLHIARLNGDSYSLSVSESKSFLSLVTSNTHNLIQCISIGPSDWSSNLRALLRVPYRKSFSIWEQSNVQIIFDVACLIIVDNFLLRFDHSCQFLLRNLHLSSGISNFLQD